MYYGSSFLLSLHKNSAYFSYCLVYFFYKLTTCLENKHKVYIDKCLDYQTKKQKDTKDT